MNNRKDSISPSNQDENHQKDSGSEIKESATSQNEISSTSKEIIEPTVSDRSDISQKSHFDHSPRKSPIHGDSDEERQEKSLQEKDDGKKRRSGLRSRKLRIIIVVLLFTALLLAIIPTLITQTNILSYKGNHNETISNNYIINRQVRTFESAMNQFYGSGNGTDLKFQNFNNSLTNQTLYRDYGALFSKNMTSFTNATSKKSTPNNLILISLDGFSPKYLSFHSESTIKYLADSGSIADGMVPVFPTVTFPNHYSIVTGVLPAYHGIVGQRFYDSKLNDWFNYKNNSRNDPKWWLVDPIWNTVQDYGLKSACCFWPGTEASIFGRKPNYNVPYQESMSNLDRINKVLGWLDLPENDGHPSFYCTYMNIVDKVGQKYGPSYNEALLDAIEDVNASIQLLVDGVISRNLTQKTNIIIVSDHGMSPVDPNLGPIRLDAIVNSNWTDSIDIFGAVAFIRPKPGLKKLVTEQLVQASIISDGFSVHEKGSFPLEFNLDSHMGIVDYRVAPLIALCKHGFTFATIKYGNATVDKGAHGYSPLNEYMDALFVAVGPDVRRNVKLGRFDILDVYNFMCSMLNIDARPNNGSTYLVDNLLNG